MPISYFVKYLRALALVCAIGFVSFGAFAQERPHGNSHSESTELPYVDPLVENTRTLDDSVIGVHVSEKYSPTSKKFHAGENLNLIVIDRLKSTADFLKSHPGYTAEAHVTSYGISDLAVFEAFRYAANAGVELHVITDFNDHVNVTFNEGENHTSNFDENSFNNKSAEGKLLIQAVADGAQVVSPTTHPALNDKIRYFLYSQPIWKKGPMNPIMHRKELQIIIRDKAKKIVAVLSDHGTNNLSTEPRMNLRIVDDDRDFALWRYQRTLEREQGFAQGKTIAQLPDAAPFRKKFVKGGISSRIVDGKHNVNDEIEAFINMAVPVDNGASNKDALLKQRNQDLARFFMLADRNAQLGQNSQHTFKIKSFTLSHYAPTDGAVFGAIKNAMTADTAITGLAVTDHSFALPIGWGGKAAGLKGYDSIFQNGGRLTYGFSSALSSRIQSYIYTRAGTPGQTTIADPRDWALWHDKTSIFDIEIDGVSMLVVFTGTFNLSNHFDNAEEQQIYLIPHDLELAKGFAEYVPAVVAIESQKPDQWAVDADTELLRDGIARLTGRAVLAVSVDEAAQALSLFRDRQYDKLEAFILSNTPQNKKRNAQAAVDRRLKKIRAAIDTYEAFGPFAGQTEPRRMTSARLFDAALGVLYPRMDKATVRDAFEHISWEPNITSEKLEQRVTALWKADGLPGNPPPSSHPQPSGPSSRQPSPSSDAPSARESRPAKIDLNSACSQLGTLGIAPISN